MTSRRIFITLLFCGCLAGNVQAIPVWDELIDGELPSSLTGNPALPNLVLQEGVNQISGSQDWVNVGSRETSDIDRARFTLLSGMQIDTVQFVFRNITLVQVPDAAPNGPTLWVSFALTKGQYLIEEVFFFDIWNLSEDQNAHLQITLPTIADFPVTEASNNYLFTSAILIKDYPFTQWDYSWDYTASITVSRSNAVPLPGTHFLLGGALVVLFRSRARA
jgi:hypothetical protein